MLKPTASALAGESAVADQPDAGRALPKFVVLQDDRGEWRAGRVVQVDADLIAALDVEGVRYIEATDEQRRLGGFID